MSLWRSSWISKWNSFNGRILKVGFWNLKIWESDFAVPLFRAWCSDPWSIFNKYYLSVIFISVIVNLNEKRKLADHIQWILIWMLIDKLVQRQNCTNCRENSTVMNPYVHQPEIVSRSSNDIWANGEGSSASWQVYSLAIPELLVLSNGKLTTFDVFIGFILITY